MDPSVRSGLQQLGWERPPSVTKDVYDLCESTNALSQLLLERLGVIQTELEGNNCVTYSAKFPTHGSRFYGPKKAQIPAEMKRVYNIRR